MLISELEKHDVAILGAGREGRSVWRRIRQRFPDMPLTIYSESPLVGEFSTVFNAAGDRVVIGRLNASALARHDVLVRSPGISIYREELVEARSAGTRFTTATSLWFAANPSARTICITGTKGKSTTAALTAHLLVDAGCRARLAGNIGRPLLDCPEPAADGDVDWWIIELSSYQLADLVAAPAISVILNLSEAHLDWHGGRSAYFEDKLRLASLASGAALITNHGDPVLRDRLGRRPGISWFNRADGFHVSGKALRNGAGEIVCRPRPSLPGAHNMANLAAALTIMQEVGLVPGKLREALDSFEGLPHRLQRLGVSGGLEFVNDSLATTPVATMAALEALSGTSVTLLIGGTKGGLDWTAVVAKMQRHRPHAIIALPDSGPELAGLIRDSGLAPAGGIVEAGNLEEAVRLAMDITPRGGTVLLSPGAPSFPQFQDYADRGLQFAGLAGFGDHGQAGTAE